jgi:hypothetical protein
MKIIINGTQQDLDTTHFTYEDLIALAGFEEGRTISITYRSKRMGDTQRSGMLIPGRSVELEDGMVFNAYDTGMA